MRIEDVTCFKTTDGRSPAVIVRITTDTGIVGWGESTSHFLPNAAAGAVEDLAPDLVGQDPRRIEFLWQMCFRRRFIRGGQATGAAIAGIDMALWDIKGKALGVPVYELLGGLARTSVRLYGHVGGMTPAEAAEQAAERAGRGITAIRFRGWHASDQEGRFDQASGVEEQVAYLAAIRERVGDEVDLILECHGRYDPQWAVELASRAAPYRPLYLEDPVRHENPEALAEVRRRVALPLAMGERGFSKWELAPLINGRLVDYVRPDICHCGGITELRKIAAMAETMYIDVVPHHNNGAIGTAASMHACVALANVALLEAPWINGTPKDGIATPLPAVENGYALPLQGAGLGIEVDEAAITSRSMKAASIPLLVGRDGSVRDW